MVCCKLVFCKELDQFFEEWMGRSIKWERLHHAKHAKSLENRDENRKRKFVQFTARTQRTCLNWAAWLLQTIITERRVLACDSRHANTAHENNKTTKNHCLNTVDENGVDTITNYRVWSTVYTSLVLQCDLKIRE